MLCAFSAPASAQARFSWAVDTEGAFYLGDKSGGYYGADAVFGLLNKQDWFWGLGIGYRRESLRNPSYNPAYEEELPPDAGFIGFFGLPKTFRPHYASLFLNAAHFWGDGEFRPTVSCRAGVYMCFGGAPGVPGTLLSAAAGYRYGLSDGTGVALRLFYERRTTGHADDVNKCLLGVFNTVGLRLSYEF